ncbi:hypothetical protein [Enterovibrio norvegicus]|uniref:hypothetical protein n=1 Tax=Enterovibrio norvegicus TaxID=188144 RepID=UPI0010545367|nr:hypothetical protein [Enterovibrio norvegicus]
MIYRIVGLLLSVVLLSGCATRGPMQSLFGPIATPNYLELLRGNIIENDENIISYSEGTSTEWIGILGGAVIQTDTRILFAQWDTDTLTYSTIYSVNISDIETYGKCKPAATTMGLLANVFCVNDGVEETVFGTKKASAILYQIKTLNPKAVRIDQ